MLRKLLHRFSPAANTSEPDVKFSKKSSIDPVDARDLPSLLPEFFLHCQDDGCKAKTLKNYHNQLEPFRVWLRQYGDTFDYQLTPDRLRQFLRWLRYDYLSQYDRPLSQNSIAATLKRIRQVFAWAHRAGYIDADLSSWVPSVSEERREIRPIDLDTMVRLFAETTNSQASKQKRDRAMLALLFGTGARREEITSIQIEQVKFHADGSGSVYLAVTKGDRPRTAVFGPVCGAFVSEYIDSLDYDRGPLWLFRKSDALYQALKRLVRRANLPDISPHDIRKFFVSYWWSHYPQDGGYDKRFLEMQIGNVPKTVTERHYVFLQSEDIAEFYVSPLEAKGPTLAQFLDAPDRILRHSRQEVRQNVRIRRE